MAEPDVSAAVVIFNKTFDLLHRGHIARSCEFLLHALDEARALGTEDCLIVAFVQLKIAQQNLALLVKTLQHRRSSTDRDMRAGLILATVQPWFEASAVVQRRKAANTLSAGACRPAEETFYEQTRVHIAQVLSDALSTESAALVGPLVGYETLLAAAETGFHLWQYAACGEFPFTVAQEHTAVTLATYAAEEMNMPRPSRAKLAMTSETVLANIFSNLEHDAPCVSTENAAALAKLLEVISSLEFDSLLSETCLRNQLEKQLIVADMLDTAAAAASVAPGLHRCALAGCGTKESHPQHFKRCAACHEVVYCCKEHQIADWPNHKPACKAARKAKAESQAY